MITFQGNDAMEDDRLAEVLAITPGQQFDPQSVNGALPRILDEYKRLGYMFAKVEWEIRPAEKDQIVLQINIHEGEMIRMGKIELSGNAALSNEQLLERLDIRSNSLFDDLAFQTDMERLLKLYSDNGHPLVKITPSEFGIEDGRLNIGIDIDEGPLVRIGQVEVKGLKKTKEPVILRELTVRPGDVFDQSEIDESKRRLNNLGYFQTVAADFKRDSSQSLSQEQNVTLGFSVTEGRTGRFSGILGYNPSEDQPEGQKLTGMLEAAETNLAGTGRKLTIRARFGLIDNYEFAYEEPWIFGTPVGIGVRLWGTNQKAQDPVDNIPGLEPQFMSPVSLKERAASLIGTTRVIRFLEGSLALTYKKIESSLSESPGIAPAGVDALTSGRKYSLTLGIQRDSRDYYINPSSGRLDRSSVEVSRGDFRTFKASLDLNQYFETRRRQVLALGLHGSRIWGETIPLTEMLYLGGANTLRGYGEDFFRGEGRLFANCEYRFLVSRDSQLFLFLDGGTVYNEGKGLDPLKLGYGVGMRLTSRTGLVSMDYGLARGDSILNGKIHVSLGAMF
jgi:outer membrane protein insertion porin family